LVVNRIVSQHEGFGRRLIDKEKEEVDAELVKMKADISDNAIFI